MKTPRILFVVMLLATTIALGQQVKTGWKEYVYPTDGFAITLPYAPEPHPSPQVPNATTYLVTLSDQKEPHLPGPSDSSVVVRVTNKPLDCLAVLGKMKTLTQASKTPESGDPKTFKEIAIDGYPGIEYQWRKGDSTTLERWYCVDSRLYMVVATHPSATAMPEGAMQILRSFRLLKAGTAK